MYLFQISHGVVISNSLHTHLHGFCMDTYYAYLFTNMDVVSKHSNGSN